MYARAQQATVGKRTDWLTRSGRYDANMLPKERRACRVGEDLEPLPTGRRILKEVSGITIYDDLQPTKVVDLECNIGVPGVVEPQTKRLARCARTYVFKN
jgi:hypothetical protein